MNTDIENKLDKIIVNKKSKPFPIRLFLFVFLLLVSFYSFSNNSNGVTGCYQLMNTVPAFGTYTYQERPDCSYPDPVKIITLQDYETLQSSQTPVTTPDAIEIAESFTWGFATYVFFWWMGYVVNVAKNTIKLM